MYLIRREADRTGMPSPSGILAALAVSTQVTAVIGPTLGGFLIGFGGWRTIFLVNVPLALASLVLGWRRLPRIPTVQPAPGEPTGLDAPGIVAFAVTLVDPDGLPHEPGPRPLVPARDRRRRPASAFVVARAHTRPHRSSTCASSRGNLPLLATYARQLLALTVSYGFLYGYTQWLEAGRGLSASADRAHPAPDVPRRRDRHDRLRAATRGLAEARRREARCSSPPARRCCSLGRDQPDLGPRRCCPLVLGVPQGLLSLANQNALYHQADPERIGASAGLLRTFTYLGALVASAANGAFFGTTVDTTGLHELAALPRRLRRPPPDPSPWSTVLSDASAEPVAVEGNS